MKWIWQRKRIYALLKQQKEEIDAQRKNVEVEAGLERVRSRAMAMKSSAELAALVATVMAELTTLDVALSWCLITILDETSRSCRVWRANTQADRLPESYFLPFADYPFQNAIMKAWKERREKWVYELKGEEKKAVDEYMFTKTEYRQLPQPVQDGIRSLDPAWFSFSFGSFGGLQVGGPTPLSEASLDILSRFGKVFDLTYTRFNDLQLAEARARELGRTLEELKATQSQLIHAEKMASLGELTAGIAHEIQNPLNFVNNFSELNTELIEEMNGELDKGAIDEAKAISGDIKQNLEKINFHGKRADSIVKNMLQHSRTSTGQKELTDINALADECMRLSYHGLRAKNKEFNARLNTRLDDSLPKLIVAAQDIGRVFLNLFTNSFYSVMQKVKKDGEAYQPLVELVTAKTDKGFEIRVRDNGLGIPAQVLDKVFHPFFTTKPVGDGTGLGLSLSYDIITKGHGGTIEVLTQEGDFAEFIIRLPY
jgi:signal transduction histidine kinase